jgi:hypothetical protein
MNYDQIKKGYNGYLLTEQARAELLGQISAVHPDVIAHHITHEFGVYDSLPPDTNTVRVIATAQNDKVQAAIVKVNATTAREHDNSFYHVTISVDRDAGGKPNDSNELVKDSRNWTAVEVFDLAVIPTFFPF